MRKQLGILGWVWKHSGLLVDVGDVFYTHVQCMIQPSFLLEVMVNLIISVVIILSFFDLVF